MKRMCIACVVGALTGIFPAATVTAENHINLRERDLSGTASQSQVGTSGGGGSFSAQSSPGIPSTNPDRPALEPSPSPVSDPAPEDGPDASPSELPPIGANPSRPEVESSRTSGSQSRTRSRSEQPRVDPDRPLPEEPSVQQTTQPAQQYILTCVTPVSQCRGVTDRQFPRGTTCQCGDNVGQTQ